MSISRRIGAMAMAAGMLASLAGAPAVALATESHASAVSATADGLPASSVEFRKASDDTIANGTFTIVSTTTADNDLRIIHHSDKTAKLDRCRVTSAGETLTPTDCAMSKFAGTGAHTWTVTAVEGGYAIQSQTADGAYLNIGAGTAVAGSEAQVLGIAKTAGGYAISRDVDGTTYYLAYAASGWTATTDPYDVSLYEKHEVTPEIVPNGKADTGTTQDLPFAAGTAGSSHFRIPSLITLKGGSLLAAIDARWNTTVDAGGLDTILSTSADGGKTWSYSFPNYFNDSTDAYDNRATSFIDPVTVQGNDGTVYMMVDVWPGGVALNSAANNHPVDSSGYAQIDGTWRLALYDSANPDEQREAGAERGTGYSHYVGDFDGGLAPVIDAHTGETTGYVDAKYYLYGTDRQPLYCQQLGSSKYVQQNVFYNNADLHVIATSYLWLTKSTDGGATWSDPLIVNEQVRTGRDGNDCFYGVGPGRGLVSSTGRIILPCYTYKYGRGDGNASVIYSDDNGATWQRSEDIDRQTSESTVVEADGRLYLFARHGVMAVSTDNGATWEDEQALSVPGITTSCQIDAIAYSKKIDGKTAILLSCPTGGSRANGAIFVGLVQQDGSIDWAYRHDVTTGGDAFAYSCLTEQADGSVSLLYEGANVASEFKTFAISDIAAGAAVNGACKVSVPLYGKVTKTVDGQFDGYEGIDASVVGVDVADNGNGTSTVTFTGKREGQVSFTESNSGVTYTVTVAAENLRELHVGVGSSATIDVAHPDVEVAADPSIVSTEVLSTPYAQLLGETPGSLGSDATYTGEVVGLSDALYTFSRNGDTWTISGTDGAGSTTYLNLGSAGYPGKSSAEGIRLTADGELEGTFKLYGTSSSRYLHFWRDGKATFDRCSNDSSGADAFELWRSNEDGTSAQSDGDAAIPGYTRVTSLEEVKDGGRYLIVAAVGGDRYALMPSLDSSSKYSHVVKVDPTRAKTQIKVTGLASGTTDLKVGGTIYRITVTGAGAETTQTHSVTFVDGLPSTADQVVKVADGERVTKPADPTYDGWTFAGWYTDKGLTCAYDFDTPVTADLTLYGGWAKAAGAGTAENPTMPDATAGGTDGEAAGNGGGTEADTGLPKTNDPAAPLGIVAALGAAATALGVGLRRSGKHDK